MKRVKVSDKLANSVNPDQATLSGVVHSFRSGLMWVHTVFLCVSVQIFRVTSFFKWEEPPGLFVHPKSHLF